MPDYSVLLSAGGRNLNGLALLARTAASPLAPRRLRPHQRRPSHSSNPAAAAAAANQENDDEGDYDHPNSSPHFLAYWNGELKIENNEVDYSLHSNRAFVLDLDVSFDEFFNELLDAIADDNLNSIKKIWGKYPKYRDGVYAASRPFPISDERTWRCFVQKATKQYDELEVYLEALYVDNQVHGEEEIEEEEQQQHHHHYHHQHHEEQQQWASNPVWWGEAGPSNTAHEVEDESDPDDPMFVFNSDDESSSDESEVSGWVSMYTPDVYTEEPTNIQNCLDDEPRYQDFPIHRPVEQVSLQPTFRIPEIQIGYTYGDFKSFQFAVSLRNIAEHRHYRTSSKRRSYWLAKCSYPDQCPWLIQAAEASIDGFKFCFPVVSVDGTHLYGKYKGVLLLAVLMTANHEIFPLAYSLVDKEDGDSWSWFMMHLMRHVVPVNMSVCIISDRHGGIDVAFNTIPQLKEQCVTRRYCLRHLRSNFQKKFNSKKLKGLMYHAASTPDVCEFNRTMQQIHTQRAEAYDWLKTLPLEKWALCCDGGARYGILTTNLSESFNHVLKGCRSLPVYAIVKTTYERLVKLFADKRTDGFTWQQAGFKFPKYVWNEVRRMEDNRLHCHVIPHHPQLGIYRVIVQGNVGATGRVDEIMVQLGQKMCSCGKWATLHMPCVHVYAVCRYCNITVDDFMPSVFSIQS
ncbi:unnamed protein product [Cuscuta campestris]|uniref:SWIM-type domain-containing protein n=1 Tax=Cuscuta campestris TaxID=132261 RepID=A0A484LG98_9ASTE|nr:unnamed protein product [Cuscuta campestris]